MKKILCWGDSPDAGTGYGTVCKHVVGAFHDSGEYLVHQLAINHHGRFSTEHGWQQLPSRLADPKDLHGAKMFTSVLVNGGYDMAWIVNDIYAVLPALPALTQAKSKAKDGKFPKLVFYFPVDCAVLPSHLPLLRFMDQLVCYNEWSRQQVLALDATLDSKLTIIPHGVDTTAFSPAPKADRDAWRKAMLNLSPDVPLVITVNRNSSRKQIPYAMLAFREFKKHVPNAVFYIHSASKDQGGDLSVAAAHAGFKPGEILFPANYTASKPFKRSQLNQIYNCGDMFLTTHLGEGYGLTVAESLAAGTPVVAPMNTSMPDLLGDDQERGYMYPCKDLAWIDSSGYRPKGLIPDIVKKMRECHAAGEKSQNPKVARGLEWARANTWQAMSKKWLELMRRVAA